jgi:Ca2+-binding RTX toxin-like protein
MAQQDGIEAVESRAPIAGRVAAGAGLALGVTLVTGGTAQAQDFTVTNLDPSGPGSLRQAIQDANNNAGPDRVLFQSDVSGTIHLNDPSGVNPPTYALYISDAVDIVGPGADQVTVSADARSRVFYVYTNPDPQDPTANDVSISGLKVIQGVSKYSRDTGNGYSYSGSRGGDIFSGGEGGGADLTLSNMVIRSGTASNRGGGVYEYYGTLTMRDSTVVANSAADQGGGIMIGENASENEPPPPVPGQADQQTVTPSVITGSTINNNSAGEKYNFNRQTSASTDATDPSPRYGGGGGIFSRSSLTVENSTVDGNSANAQGGGIYLDAYQYDTRAAGSPSLSIRSATISGNTAGSGGGIYWYSFKPYNGTGPDAPNPVIENSIVAQNNADQTPNGNDLAGARAQGVESGPPTATDPVFDAAFSLIKDTTGVTVNETVPGSNITGQDPQLGALNDNGGPTQTMALQPGSPAIDHGRTPAGETTDQRGQTRPFDLPDIGNSAAPGADGADMGAFEVQGAVPTGTCEGKPATLSGTENRDILNGTPGPDVIVGFGGNDTIKGFQGDDIICAGDGLDQVTGGIGNDRIHGEGGNDRSWGQGGNDTLLDTQGDDLLSGGLGNDTEKGGAGEDRVFGADGNDRLFGEAASDVILGAKGNDFLRGGPGNDRLSGGVGVNDVQQ